MSELCIEIERWLEANAARFERHIPPTESDRDWFVRNRKSHNGWPRLYRVRDSIKSDHYVFDLCGVSPAGCLTIIRGEQYWRAIVSAAEDRFGPVVDSD